MIVSTGDITADLKGSGPFTARPAIDKPVTNRACRIVHPGVREWYDVTTQPDDWPSWYVAGPDGRRNVLTFPDKPGAVFTDKATARAIADTANGSCASTSAG